MTQSHSPLPWSFDNDGFTNVELCDGNGRYFCEIDIVDAEFVVRAVNSHDALVESVVNLMELAERYRDERWFDKVMAKRYMDRASETIKLARGESSGKDGEA